MFSENDYGIFFYEEKLLQLANDQQFIIPINKIYADEAMLVQKNNIYFLEESDKKRIYVVQLQSINQKNPLYTFIPVREFLKSSDTLLFKLICRSKQLLYWHLSSLYCGSCGSETVLSESETAKICLSCSRVIYPSASPAVIVLIENGDNILLARSHHFAQGIYSTLAGFINPGETCEEAICREVQEEVGIQIKEIEYFGSQSWPFPNSFMLGFKAKYASGDIQVDPTEIEDAKWFNILQLPKLPAKTSIARHLIDSFIEQKKSR